MAADSRFLLWKSIIIDHNERKRAKEQRSTKHQRDEALAKKTDCVALWQIRWLRRLWPRAHAHLK